MKLDSMSVSYVFLWLLVLALAWTVIYMLNSRRPPRKPDTPGDHGLPLQKPFPEQRMTSFYGEEIAVVPPDKQGAILLFLSVTCKSCQPLYSVIRKLPVLYPDYQVIVWILGRSEDVSEKINENSLHRSNIVHQKELQYRTTTYPYCYWIDKEGRVVAKGAVGSEDDIANLGKSTTDTTERR
ncbi:hypothetical protein [Paenibacillus koleovorans]|uniref:hypothetical protein n=1 Tax=Paenibacillus koleovorans TaxID=121608 RepID=UPI000FD90E0E|nr:hypothetical protein [Paenibacillus koleovorans]